MMKKFILSGFCLMIFAFAANAQTKPTVKTSASKVTKKTNQRPNVPAPKTAAADPFEKADVKTMSEQCVTLETEAGNIVIEMFPESAPESVRNFLNLAASKSLDTTNFNRVVKDFIIQGGDLSTNEKWNAELSKRASKPLIDEPNQIKHERGIVSMARADTPNSATTNFFILNGTASHLDGTFAAFGRVTKGMEVADAINKMPVENEKPTKPVKIKRAIVAPCSIQN
jgi:peptidyl-prolyl cis-trans isomerase B (cyclophilin B)